MYLLENKVKGNGVSITMIDLTPIANAISFGDGVPNVAGGHKTLVTARALT